MSWAEKVQEAPSVIRKLEILGEAIDWLAAPKPKKQQCAGSPVESVDSLRVFEHWQTVMGRSQAKFTPERRKHVKARLKDGYSVDLIRDAIDGCAGSDFHMARGEYAAGKPFNDLTLICRNGSKLEQFAQMEKGSGPSAKFLGT